MLRAFSRKAKQLVYQLGKLFRELYKNYRACE
jgi:hypothetical protein